MDGTVLVADDDRTIRTVLTQALTRAGCRVHATASLVTLLRWVEEGKGDLVITDVVMPDGNGLTTLPAITRMRPDLPVIVISAQNTMMTAIRATEAAAFDYLPKPFDLPDLMKRAAKGLDRKRHAIPQGAVPVGLAARSAARPVVGPAAVPAPESASAPHAEADPMPLIGRSAPMQALYRAVARIKQTDLPVLILGPSGSGKSLLARALHDLSDRRDLPFVTVTGADLMPAEGENPDAAQARLLAQVGAGTLVLEQLADFGPEAQARAVRLIDSLPATNPPRVIATSVAGATGLREDLFYRLSGATLSLPPLADRTQDIALLATHFLARHGHGPEVTLPEAVAERLRSHPWPGNVRQLENAMRHLALIAPDLSQLVPADLEPVLGRAAPVASAGVPDGERMGDAIARHLRRYFDLHGDTLPPPGLYDRILREMELPLLTIALEATGGNQARCADLLGINRNTLHKKIVSLDMNVTRRRKLM